MATATEDHDPDTAVARPPFLRRVRIQGYKSIAFCDVTLQPLTILVGRNASGKSNFIGALAFLHDTVENGIAEAIKRHGGHWQIITRDAEEQAVSIEIEAESPWFGSNHWDVVYELTVSIPKKRA